MKNTSRKYLYSKGFPDGKIFEVDEEIPDGFFDTPTKIKEPEAPKKKLKSIKKKTNALSK